MNYFKTDEISIGVIRCFYLRIDKECVWQRDLWHIRYSEVLNVGKVCTIFFQVLICCL